MLLNKESMFSVVCLTKGNKFYSLKTDVPTKTNKEIILQNHGKRNRKQN